MLKAKAKNIVLQTIIKEVAESMTEIKVKGELQTVSMLEALVKKMIALASKDDKALLRVINMVLEYESRNAVLTQRQEIIDRRNGDNDDETFNDSFIQALNAQAGEVWTNNE